MKRAPPSSQQPWSATCTTAYSYEHEHHRTSGIDTPGGAVRHDMVSVRESQILHQQGHRENEQGTDGDQPD